MPESALIHHDVRRQRFELVLRDECAYLAYMDLGDHTLDFYRTYVPESMRGQGIAERLTRHALTYAQRMGYRVIPSCSYVERYLRRSGS